MVPVIDLSAFVEHLPDGTLRLDFAVEGIDCAACIGDIERGLAALPGVAARVNYTHRRVGVSWRDEALDPARIVARFAALGYRAHPFQPSRQEEIEGAETRFLLRCLAVAGFAAMNIMLLSVSVWSGNASDITDETRDLFHWLSALIALPAAAYAGQPFFRNAARAIRNRSLTMDVPISLGVVLALSLSLYETIHSAHHAYFDSAVMLLFFLLLGRVLDQTMRRRTRLVADNLMAMRGERALLIDADGSLREVPVRAVKPGDLVFVRPGERIGIDGVVAVGSSEVDASLVTGETARAPVSVGTQVYAGTLNIAGALTIRATAAAEASLLSEVNRLIENAANARSRYLRLADRAAQIYSPIVHVTALLTAIGWLLAGATLHDALVTAIAVLIITCPCALALAVPATQVVAAGALFRAGLLLQSADAIERIAACDTIAFDKTGTLTLPEPRIVNRADIDPGLLALASRLALSSSHPLAIALAMDAGTQATPVPGAEERPGEGVLAVVDGVEVRLGSAVFCHAQTEMSALLAQDPAMTAIALRHGDRLAVFALRQTLRHNAASVVFELHKSGYQTLILSGDRAEPVGLVAEALAIKNWHAGLKPSDKIAALEEIASKGRRVLMVGDGLNDAPALAAAHASLSPVTATHLAQAAADALFLGEALTPVCSALDIARHALRIMRQNLGIAIAYNMVAVPLAITGHVTPLIAALAMSGSSILVTVNALRAGHADPRLIVPRQPRPSSAMTPPRSPETISA
jgi:Cu2+-exporting ATPase